MSPMALMTVSTPIKIPVSSMLSLISAMWIFTPLFLNARMDVLLLEAGRMSASTCWVYVNKVCDDTWGLFYCFAGFEEPGDDGPPCASCCAYNENSRFCHFEDKGKCFGDLLEYELF